MYLVIGVDSRLKISVCVSRTIRGHSLASLWVRLEIGPFPSSVSKLDLSLLCSGEAVESGRISGVDESTVTRHTLQTQENRDRLHHRPIQGSFPVRTGL